MSGSTSDAVRRKTCYGDLHIDMEGLPQTLEFGQIVRPSLGVVKIIAKFPPARASGILKLPQLARNRKLFQFMASQIRYFIFIIFIIFIIFTVLNYSCNYFCAELQFCPQFLALHHTGSCHDQAKKHRRPKSKNNFNNFVTSTTQILLFLRT